MNPMNSPGDIAQNMPNTSLMYQTYTPTFGNINFSVQPSQTGKVNDTFGILPYLSLESLVYMQQVQAQTNQVNTTSTQMAGQQNVTGALTVSDNSGNVVAQISAGQLPASGAASTAQPAS